MVEQAETLEKEYKKGSALISTDEIITFIFELEGDDVTIEKYNGNVDIVPNDVKVSLMMLDSRMLHLLVHMIRYYYELGECKCSKLIKRIAEEDPLGYEESYIYEYKFKKFLNRCALGLINNSKDIYNQNDTYSIVNSDGEYLKYHVYMNEYFEQYLFDNSFIKCNIIDNVSSCETLNTQTEKVIGVQFQVYLD